MSKVPSVSTAILLLAAVSVADSAIAQQKMPDRAFGTSAANAPSARSLRGSAAAALGYIYPTSGYSYGLVASGGVGLRNRGAGAINISVRNPVQAAFLYWAVITDNAPTPANSSLRIKRLAPTVSADTLLTGVVVGSGANPCWTYGNTTTVYRAKVPLTVANGSGTYLITLQPGASGLTDGTDPWSSQVLPMMEGASLVIVGTSPNPNTVRIYDTKLSGTTFNASVGQSYQLVFPTSFSGAGSVVFMNIGADGQKDGTATVATPGVTQEKTTINGIVVAGPGSAANDSDWNGNIADPLPQLWDDTNRDITAAARAGGAHKYLNIRITAPDPSNADCIVPVVNAVTKF